MDVVKSYQNTLNYLGIGEKDGKFKIQVYVFLIVQAIVITNTLCFLVDRWNDLDDRIIACKTVLVLSTFLVYSVLFVYNWEEFLEVIGSFYNMNYEIPYQISSKRNDLISLFKMNVEKLNTSWWTMVLVYLASLNIIPLIIVTIKLLCFNEDFQKVMKENLSLPFPLYFPQWVRNFEDLEWLLNVVVYIVGYSLHSTYTVYAAVLARLVYDTAMCALTNVEYELKLLTLSLTEMEDFIQEDQNNAHSYHEHVRQNESLKFFFKYFVKHHENTNRRFNIVNRGIRWIAATLSSIASLYICMSIYVIVQRDQIVLKIEESLFFLIWAYAIYLFDDYGERVTTENESLRNALYECSWTDKPFWFKKSLLIVMTRCCKSTELKPFGLFVLNLKNFAKTMNAAYSYYNLLHNFKRQ